MHRSARLTKEGREATHLSALVHRIYDAGVRPEQWSGVVADIAASFNAATALLFTPYLAPQHGGMLFPVNFPEADLQLWATTYIDQDLWAINSAKKGLFQTGYVALDDEMVSREEFLASPFYCDYLRRIGIGRVCAGVVFGGSPGLPGMVLSVYRADADPAFDGADKEWMGLLISHVSRAMGIMQQLNTARVQNASLLASFDRLKFGVVLLNEQLRVLHVNTAAQAVLDHNNGLRIDAHRHLDSRNEVGPGLSLSRWLAAVRDTPMNEQRHFLDGCTVVREGGGDAGKRCYSIQCAPVPALSAWYARDEAVRYAVFITDPSTIQLPGSAQLQKMYKLTSTQARVALEFAGGGTYGQVARRLLISEETVRSHIKEIYPKVRVNRLADLVRLVISLGQNSV